MTTANIKLLADIIQCFFSVRYATTTRSLSRYSCYSLRTFFRFFQQDHDWIAIRLSLLKAFVFKQAKHFIAAADEVVEAKSGKHSFGLGRFYSSIAQKPVSGICFFGLSFIDVDRACSYMIGLEQVVHTGADQERISEQKNKRKAGKERTAKGQTLAKGRKKGIKNKPKPENNTASYRAFKSLWNHTMNLLKDYLPLIKLTHLVADSAYSSLDYLKLAAAHQIHLISRLSANAALYRLYDGSHSRVGAKKIYGDRWNLSALPGKYLKKRASDEQYRHEFYQIQALSKSIKGIGLNVVVLKTTRLKDNKESINLFFSNDLTLAYQTMLNYYSLRFQIEFDFRDAKQHFGLSDFKNYQEKNLSTFVNLSFLLCLVSKILLEEYRLKLAIAQLSVLDLKIIFSTRNTVRKLFKLSQQSPDMIFNQDFCDQFVPDDLINAA